jgi:DNA-directed RNA polymerase sigma subunit (sigma70/sigma32)
MDEHMADDRVTMYLREVANVEPLSKEEEAKLFRELRQYSDDLRENPARRIIESQLSSVLRIAERYSSSGIAMLDLIQQGNLGLMDAVRGFAQTPVGEFPAYAAARIEEAIQNFIASQDGR